MKHLPSGPITGREEHQEDAARAVAEAKTQVREESSEALSQQGQLLTQSRDVVRQWKNHYEELLNLSNMSRGRV